MSHEKQQPTMTAERAQVLLNSIINHMVNDAGGHVREVIDELLGLGFTADELTEEFQFCETDVEECLRNDEEAEQ